LYDNDDDDYEIPDLEDVPHSNYIKKVTDMNDKEDEEEEA